MIFYFSGTGNSLWVAKELSKAFGEPLLSVAQALKESGDRVYNLREEEKIFFVYPVHSWGPAVLMHRFIDRLCLKGYDHQPVYSICTCGDECGYTEKKIYKWLASKGLSLTGSYSIEMPNNYVLLPGFDVDPVGVEQKKLRNAVLRVEQVIGAIREPRADKLYKVGNMPFLKSEIIYPLFARYAIRKNRFYATDDCISCGICVKRCPTDTISMRKGEKPIWRKDSCVQCVACIHYCPERAIEYGKVSIRKGRYHFPEE